MARKATTARRAATKDGTEVAAKTMERACQKAGKARRETLERRVPRRARSSAGSVARKGTMQQSAARG